MRFQEKIVEGKYNYYQHDQLYCEEHFKLFRQEESRGNYNFNAELMSRVDTGEFLKVFVDYELTHNFEPVNLRIKRTLGANKSTERFSVDLKDKKVRYVFNGKDGIHESERLISGRFHIAAPAFCVSMLMTESRKVDPVHRTSYNIISSENIWEFAETFKESTLYIELMSLEPVTINLHDNEVQATHCNIYEEDKIKNPNAQGHPIYISKHYQIPYKAEFANGIRVEVQNLKNYESDLKGAF